MKKKLFCMMLAVSLMIPIMPVHATEIQGEQEAVKESISEDMPSIDKVETTEGEAIPDNEKVVEEQEAIVDNEIVTEENESIVDNGELNEEKESIIDNTEDVIESEQTEEIVLDNENETDVDKNDTSEEEAEKVSEELEETQSEVQEKEEVEEIESEAAKEITEVDTIVESDEVISVSNGNAEDSMENLLEECAVDEINTAGNSMSDATSISLGSTYSGRISDTNSIDYYKVIIPSSGQINLKSEGRIERIIYHIYDSEGNEVWYNNAYWNSTTEKLFVDERIDLIKGTYYLVVERWSLHGDYIIGSYSFILNHVSANESFIETNNSNNNSIDTANKIQLNTEYKGQIAENDSKDFYQFTLGKSGRIKLKAESNMDLVEYRVYDSKGNQLWYERPEMNSTTQKNVIDRVIDLTKGNYYFMVERSSNIYGRYFDAGNYSFALNYTSANESFVESGDTNNNSVDTANKIQLNMEYKGQIAENDSKDFYQFTMATSGRVRFETTAKMEDVIYRVYNSEGKELWYNDASWNSVTGKITINEEIDLSKGTYFFVVERRANIYGYYLATGNYQFSFSTGPKFTDVPLGAFYEDAVEWAVNNDVTVGTGNNKFSPHNTCTRAQVVTFLWRAMGEPEPRYTKNIFSDVKEEQYYYKAVLWAVENGITSGTGNGKFEPNTPCTRAHVVTFLWRLNGEKKSYGSMNFADVPKGMYYTDAVTWAVNNDITKGTGNGRFSPNDYCTRGQIVTFLHRNFGE